MANSRTTQPDDENPERIIDAAPDPQVTRANELHERSTTDAEFAELEATFARRQRDYSDQLASEGRAEEAELYARDALVHLKDAGRVMEQARDEEAEAERIRRQQHRKLSTSLQTMGDQQLATLRDAVRSVRLMVEEFTPRDIQSMRRLAQLRDPEIDEERIQTWRETAITAALNIEVSLANHDEARHNAAELVRDLSIWAAAVVELARLAQPLKDLIMQYGHLLLQFHL